MRSPYLVLLLCLAMTGTALAQENFTIEPAQPKAGDLITITYAPAGVLMGSLRPVEAAYYETGFAVNGWKSIAAENLRLQREGKKYTATIQTDTGAHFLFFSFSADKQFDNNNNNGYYVMLHEGDKPRRGANNALSLFYQYYGRNVGVESSAAKALEALQKEMELYPADRKNYLVTYVRLLNSAKKEEAPRLVQKEIEALLKSGLKEETDYALLEAVYNTARLPEQARLVTALRKEKYPNGRWQMEEYVRKFYAESDPLKAQRMADTMLQKIESDPAWASYKGNEAGFRQQPLYLFSDKKDYAGLENALANITFSSEADKASLLNNIAWEIQKSGQHLDIAERFSRFATQWAKNEMNAPSAKKPAHITTKEWENQRKYSYAMYADTYAMVMYRMGEYKKALPYARDAALKIHNGNDAEQNNTYALIAEKTLPKKQYREEILNFVRNGRSTGEMTAILKRAYVAEKGSEEGFENYMEAVRKEQYLKLVAELRKKMINEPAPSFALLDLDGNKVDLGSLKGKTVVVDFWATWCGPCIASFPGMQKAVNRFKENPAVQFVFIDTWESGDNKKQKVAEFITSTKYNFRVLMDDENKIVEEYKVEGIPTKFIIDPNGNIRFKSVGFSGSDEKVVEEITAMIELATDSKKVF